MRLRRSPFTLSWLMTLVAILGIELAALRSQSVLGDTLAFNVAAAVLIFASFGARFGAESAKAFWFGFAVMGWAQLVLGMLLLEISFWEKGKLPTNRLTIELVNWALPATLGKGDPNVNRRFANLDEIQRHHRSYDIRFLYQKANAVVSIGVAVLGGLLAQVLGSRGAGRGPVIRAPDRTDQDIPDRGKSRSVLEGGAETR